MVETLRILHVEDSERDFELIQRAVELSGHDVYGMRVETGDALTAALVDAAWDVVLLDCSMPRFDSLRAIETVRQYDLDLPLILVSGTIGEELAVGLMRAGAADYIMKDNLARLVPAIEREVVDAGHRRARRAAEARLHDRERMLTAAQQVAQLGSWVLPLPAGRVSWSEEVSTIIGGEPPEDAEDLQFFLNAVHPDDREGIEQLIFSAVSSGEEVEVEHRVIHVDGSERWILLQVGSESAADGRPSRLVGTLLDITERKRADQALRDSERKYRLLLEQAADGILVTNDQGRVEIVNSRACEMLGYTPEEFMGRHIESFLEPAELAERPLRAEQLRSGQTLRNERSLRSKGGGYVPTETSSRVLDDGSVQIIIRDITERQEAEAALRRSEQEYRQLFERASDAVIIIDIERELVLDVNPRACELYGIAYDDFVELGLRDLAGHFVNGHAEDAARLLVREMQGHEAEIRHTDGMQLHVLVSASLVEFRGHRCALSIQRDVTDQKRLEEQLRHQALHDALSGLANRALFQDRLEHALSRARQAQYDVAVLVLDLDRFKLINDSLGHDLGDRMLVGVAARLLECVRDGDTVARLGGDEFTILLEGVANMREVTLVAERVTNALRMHFHLDGHDIVVTASVGIAVATHGSGTPETLMSHADVAMYRAKDAGRSGYVIFDPSMNATMLERLELETGLRVAIDRGQLRAHYQPTVDIKSSRVVGMEALVRWEHPTRGQLPPGAFIPLAEEAGLVRMIDQWILGHACRQLAAWTESYRDAPLILNVNVSAQSIQHPDMVRDIAAVLDETGVDPQQLQLEITESVIMADAGATHSRLRHLKELGVRLAIDDFGTGYSSLSYLKRFPVDTLKVDRSFVDGLGTEAEDSAIVEAIISLGRALELQIVAEGVETDVVAHRLQELGCSLGQGYRFARPLPADQFERLLAAGFSVRLDWQSRRAG